MYPIFKKALLSCGQNSKPQTIAQGLQQDNFENQAQNIILKIIKIQMKAVF
jgi:hypothetical protein